MVGLGWVTLSKLPDFSFPNISCFIRSLPFSQVTIFKFVLNCPFEGLVRTFSGFLGSQLISAAFSFLGSFARLRFLKVSFFFLVLGAYPGGAPFPVVA